MTQSEPIQTFDLAAVPPRADPCPTHPAYFETALKDAERLLKYAAESGVDVDEPTRCAILHARAVGVGQWDETTASHLLVALSSLAARLKPVTAESLKACTLETRPTVRRYWMVAIALAVVITPFSLASFVATAISGTVRSDIAAANDLAVKLRSQLGPPGAAPKRGAGAPDDATIITELQEYATAIRAIDARGRQLNALAFFAERDPFASIRDNPAELHKKFQLPEGLADFSAAANDRTMVYQDVRYFAQSALDDISFFYGAVSACLLPVLYALLGTCAYLLRAFEQQMATHTFMPSIANSARFLIAAIGGAVIGLFSNFTMGQQGVSIPPLALAFLVGYAVDVFFAFLESVLQGFTRAAYGSGTPAAAPPQVPSVGAKR